MASLVVNTPSGRQEIIDIGETGGYFDPSLVIWDTRIDGPLAEDCEAGKMTTSEITELVEVKSIVDDVEVIEEVEVTKKILVKSGDYLPAHTAALAEKLKPKIVPMACARIAMANAGVLDDVKTLIDTLGVTAQNYFEYWPEVARDNPIVEQVRVGMGWTHEYLDELFVSAETVRKNF